MWRLTAVYTRLVRPHLVNGLVTVMIVAAGGYASLPQILAPVQAADVPVIQPMEPKVQGITISAPIDCAKVACLALTFDDGPKADVTPRVLDALERYNAKATFFLIGVHVPGNEAIVRRIHQSGHELGNHTWGHRDLSKLSPQEVEDEIAYAQQAIAAAGVPAPRLLRPPYGAFNTVVRSHASMTVVAWNVDPEDWKAKKPEKIVEHVLANAKPGAIVDLHDVYDVTAEALDPLLAALTQSYHLVTVSELLNLPPGQPGIFYGR